MDMERETETGRQGDRDADGDGDGAAQRRHQQGAELERGEEGVPALLGVCANTNALYTHVCLDCEMVCLTAEETSGEWE